jgi:putative inorganic carbon (hco3(-)) transporter
MSYNKFILIGIYIFVLFVPLLPYKIKISSIPVSADLAIISYLILIIFFMFLKSKTRHKLIEGLKEFFQTKMFAAIILYSLICMVTLIVATSKVLVISELLRFWTYVIIFFIITAFVEKRKEIRNILGLLILSVTIHA